MPVLESPNCSKEGKGIYIRESLGSTLFLGESPIDGKAEDFCMMAQGRDGRALTWKRAGKTIELTWVHDFRSQLQRRSRSNGSWMDCDCQQAFALVLFCNHLHEPCLR